MKAGFEREVMRGRQIVERTAMPQERRYRQVRQATAWTEATATTNRTGKETVSEVLAESSAPVDECGAGPTPLEPGRVYARVAGRDSTARLLSDEDLAELEDPMAALFRNKVFPLTVQDLLAALPANATESRRVYLVSEAGQFSAPGLQRVVRSVFTMSVITRDVDLLVATQATGEPKDVFLQVASWDDKARHFNFYSRLQHAWVWAGNSWDALKPDSRGMGCFDSHVNGSVVMKELKVPWLNWHSMRGKIHFEPQDPIRSDPLYKQDQVDGAEGLERTVKDLVQRWTEARLAKVTSSADIEHPRHLLRQLLTTTTVNLASADIESLSIERAGPPLIVPMGFWLNSDALVNILGLDISADRPALPAGAYVDSRTRFGMHLRQGDFRQPGDAFFAFVCPEAALEDNEVVGQMVSCGLISARFAACCLMVDFFNPVFSTARAQLMRHVPRSPTPKGALEDTIVRAIASSDWADDSPEKQFMDCWQVPEGEWRSLFAERLDTYLRRVAEHARTQVGCDDYMRLAESRRRQFRSRPLNEFSLTTPFTNILPNAPLLAMREDGTPTPLTPADR
ncbi:hypothetical protein ACFWSF_34175 [Streptomyces sp. NPDC058611]|uniref:hypothetical protein n=1 Tax=unclassified Streptomyces TaxID=2593676 RepID=UPI003646F391